MTTFGERIKTLRLSRGYTQQDLADILGTAKSTISMYENDNRNPDFETLEAIADLFNVNMDYLLGRSMEQGNILSATLTLDEQLQGIEFALWGEVKELTDDEKQDILDFVKFKKSQRK